MREIKTIAFDADDTLWSNEPFFQDIEREYTGLLSTYGESKEISDELFHTEMNNLERYGYGAKGFTLSMIETALRISKREVASETVEKILLLGKSLLDMPIELLPEVKETLDLLKQNKCYQLVVATKGDLLDQQRKLQRSGLSSYFDHVEIMPDKTEKEYTQLIEKLRISPSQFLMVGNSLKSDIRPVLAIGGYAIHIPFEIMWQHEVVEHFEHPRLYQLKRLGELTELLQLSVNKKTAESSNTDGHR